MDFTTNSLRQRLLISAALLLLVFLGLMGLGLNNAFKQSVLNNAQDSLRNQIVLLISNIDVIDAKLSVPEVLSEARLSQADSDLFAQISSPIDGVIWRSASLLGRELPELSGSLGDFRFFSDVDWPDNPSVYATNLTVEWETEQGDLPFIIQVAEKTDAYHKRLAAYQQQIAIWLSVLGASLLVLLLALLSWALRPLVRVTRQVSEIEQGKRQRFDEDYPNEVSRLTQNLNQLLNFDEQRITRQKEVLGNLAHSLKTPIAVLKGLKFGTKNIVEVTQQLNAMQTIIDYQLQSASAVGRRRFARPIDVQSATEQIVSSLDKLYQSKGISCTIEFTPDTQFYGDQGDWMELVGNLLDNAYKWAASHVALVVSNVPLKEGTSHRSATQLIVEDDGVGIDDELKATILQRGVRLDSQTPGHGLGLHIVKGIVEAYEGELDIVDNQPKGTRFQVTLN